MKFNEIEKRYLWIGGAVIAFILFAIAAMILIKNLNKSQPVRPVMLPQATAMATQTLAPTVAPTALPGNIWVVKETKVDTIHENGFNYIVDIFYNESQPNLTIRASCRAPGWPAPVVGQRYVMMSDGLLVPIEGIDSPLQRFLKIP